MHKCTGAYIYSYIYLYILIYISLCKWKLVQIAEADPRQCTLLVFILKRSVREGGRNNWKEHMKKELGEMPLNRKLQSSVCEPGQRLEVYTIIGQRNFEDRKPRIKASFALVLQTDAGWLQGPDFSISRDKVPESVEVLHPQHSIMSLLCRQVCSGNRALAELNTAE